MTPLDLVLGGLLVLCVVIIYIMQHIIDDLVETRTCTRLHLADASDMAFSKPALMPRHSATFVIGNSGSATFYGSGHIEKSGGTSRHTWDGGPTDAA